MSSVDTIFIQGIRSFGPEAEHAQKLQFFSPLTLIVGPNGSGKTTIVECLRYVTTGEMPPGTKQDAAFIYDPKLANQTSVKSQVKLRFTDVRGDMFQVTRVVESIQKKNAVSMRTLDATLHRHRDGKLESLPGKCADVHAEVTSLLGVSRAILESVVFCLQDDQFWPLLEPKSVKEKFDDIFASGDYVRAIEAIKKLRTGQMSETQTARSNIPYLRTLRDAVREKREARETKVKKRDTLTSKIAESRRLADTLAEQLKRLQTRKSEYATLKESLAKLTGERSQLETSLKQLKRTAQPDTLERARKCTRTELDDALRRIATERSRISHEIGEAQFSVEECDRSRARVETTVKPLCERETRLRIELEQFDATRAALELDVQRFNESFHLVHLDGSSGASQVDRDQFLAALGSRIGQLEATVGEAQARHGVERRTLDERLQTRAAELTKRTEQTSVKAQELARLRAETAKLRKELDEVRAELSANEHEVERNGELNQRLVTLDSRAQEVADVRRRFDELRAKRAADEVLATRFERRLSQRQADANRSMQIDVLRSRAREAQDEMRRVLDRHTDALRTLFTNDSDVMALLHSGQVQRTGLRFKKCQETLSRTLLTEIRSRRTEQTRTAAQLTEFNTQRSMLRERLAHIETDVLTKRAALAELAGLAAGSGSGGDRFEAALGDAKSLKTDLNDRKGLLTGKLKMFEDYAKKIRGQRERAAEERARAATCCPLCRRSFERQSEASQLVDELETEYSVRIPGELEQLEVDLMNATKRYEDLLASRSSFVELERLERELEELRNKRLESVERDVLRLRGESEAHEVALRDLERNEALLKQVANDLYLFDTRARDLEDSNEQLERLGQSNADSAGDDQSADDVELANQTLEELTRRTSELRSAVQRAQIEMDEYQNTILKYSEERQKVLDELNTLGSLRTQIDTKRQRAAVLTEAIDRTSSDAGSLDRELETIRSVELRTLAANVEEARDACTQLQNSHEERLGKMQEQLAQLVEARDSLERQSKQLSAFRADEKRSEKAALDRRIEELRAELSNAEQRVSEARRLIDALRQRENDQNALERDAQNAIALKGKMLEMDDVTGRVQEVEASIAVLRVDEVERELHELAKRIDSHKAEAYTKQGELGQLERELSDLERDLNTKQSREANQALLNKRIEMTVRNRAASDLNTIMQCLEKAILTYHQHKMTEINKIMRNLWRSTYKGNDIDFIQILTDEDDDGHGQPGTSDTPASMQIGTSNRRRYRYRVVMSKGGQLLDLRGRCSAGQKVLASIVIRLALAEVFGGRCAMLALDEPTTNLDQENVASLAEALIEIVNQRRTQKNFQLIIITHDEDFVKLLSRAEFVTEYYRISRGPDACSNIEKRLIHEFHDD